MTVRAWESGRTRAARLLSCRVVFVAITLYGVFPTLVASVASARPSGEVEMTQRVTKVDGNDHVLQSSYSGYLTGGNYIWRPWLGSWTGKFGASHFNHDGESESNSVDGNGVLLLFPQSSFPLTAYASVTDTRISRDDSFNNDSGDKRFMRFGANQQYRGLLGMDNSTLQFERDVEKDLNQGYETIHNLAHFRTEKKTELHSFQSMVLFENRRNQEFNYKEDELVFDFDHVFRPNVNFSVENAANFNILNNEGAGVQSEARGGTFSSSTAWRDPNRPLIVRGVVRGLVQDNEVEGEETADDLAGTISGGAQYDITQFLHAGADLDFEFEEGDEPLKRGSVNSTYSPERIPFYSMDYNWHVRGRLTYEEQRDEDGGPGGDGSFDHGLSKRTTLKGRPVTFSFDVGQTLYVTEPAIGSGTIGLSHRGSLSMVKSTRRGVSSLRFYVLDTRLDTDEGDTVNQVASLELMMNRSLSRYNSFEARMHLNANMGDDSNNSEGSDDDERRFRFEVIYRDQRLLGVRRLRFRSQLEVEAEEFYPTSLAEDEGDIVTWENRLDYVIGRVTVSTTHNFQRSNGRNANSLYLSVRRSF